LLPHTQQEIADAVGVNPTDKCLRLSGNLDTCPKNQKLAALFEETLSDLDKCPKPIKIAARARRHLVCQKSDKHDSPHTHTQQEIVDAVGMSVGAVNQRTSVCSDLDKCPKV